MTETPLDERVKDLEKQHDFAARVKALEDSPLRAARAPWREPKMLAFFGSLIAIVPPFTAGVIGAIDSARQLELERAKQTQQVREHYLDRALSSQDNLAERQLVLRFLAKIQDDKTVSEWAKEELGRVDKKLEDAQQQISQLEKHNIDLQEKFKAAEAKISSLQTSSTSNARTANELKEEKQRANQLRAEMQVLTAKLEAAQKRVRGDPVLQARLDACLAEKQVAERRAELAQVKLDFLGPPRAAD